MQPKYSLTLEEIEIVCQRYLNNFCEDPYHTRSFT